MLKMYHRRTESGSSPAYWEEAWNDGGFDEALRFCEIDPLRPLFERYAKPGMWMLEGGCGRGQYVAYYSAKGVKVVGLDFAREALSELRGKDAKLPLCAGDVSRLPFRDESFDVYYSGGVVEHFESGAEPSLKEARRVLKPGGVLLVSVPYFSPFKRMVSLVRNEDRRRVAGPVVDRAEERDGWRFFQYAYTTREFRNMLVGAGFRVVETKGYSILWGLYELPFAERLVQSVTGRRIGRNGSVAHDAPVAVSQVGSNPAAASASLLKRLVIGEDDSVPAAGLAVRVMRWACANMMMYVCVK